MGLRDNVTLGAFIDPLEMPHAYASSYAFLHTSTWPEPFARGPVEALAAGTAVIATSTGGTPEIIRNEVTGLLVPPDDPQAISEACNRLLSDAPLLRRLGETGRAEVQARFDIKVQIECYVAAYQRVL